jgi:hypothetical protein
MGDYRGGQGILVRRCKLIEGQHEGCSGGFRGQCDTEEAVIVSKTSSQGWCESGIRGRPIRHLLLLIF